MWPKTAHTCNKTKENTCHKLQPTQQLLNNIWFYSFACMQAGCMETHIFGITCSVFAQSPLCKNLIICLIPN